MILLLLPLLGVAGEVPLDWRLESTWRSPTLPERAAVLRAVDAVVQDAEACSAPVLDRAKRALEGVGLRLDVVELDGARVVRIGEGDQAFGAGLLAVRCGPALDLVWQAPHPRFDLHTGDLVLTWFRESRSRAAMWATHHRFRATAGEVREDPVHPADVAAEPGSLFQAMTVAVAVADPDLRFVQVHGYAAASAPGLEAIVSTGDAGRPPNRLEAPLEGLLGEVGIYGDGTLELGGTRNVQGRMLARWPGRFLHLELSPAARDRLRSDVALRSSVTRVLEAGW
jgi:hypothetical protein